MDLDNSITWWCIGDLNVLRVELLQLIEEAFKILNCDDVFFFSSRRRHTRFDCDWSSDVCSSDLLRRRRDGRDHRPGAKDRVVAGGRRRRRVLAPERDSRPARRGMEAGPRVPPRGAARHRGSAAQRDEDRSYHRVFDGRPHSHGRAQRYRVVVGRAAVADARSEEHTSELQSQSNLVCRLLLEKKKNATTYTSRPTDSRSDMPQRPTTRH